MYDPVFIAIFVIAFVVLLGAVLHFTENKIIAYKNRRWHRERIKKIKSRSSHQHND